MTMIQCPKCGQEISDKAKKCIHCGKVFVEDTESVKETKCPKCGAVLSDSDETCPNCGCPIEKNSESNETKPQQVEAASIKVAKKTKKIIVGIVIAVLACIAVGIGYKVYSDNKAEDEYQTAYNEYISNLEKVQVLMIAGGSDAESICNLTLRVWDNAMSEELDDKTDKYTRPNGWWVNDFSEALVNLYTDSSTTTKVSSIIDNQSSVKDLIKKLQNPPEGLDQCYDTVSDLYEAYKVLTDLAIDPSGSYSDLDENKSYAESEFMFAYEKLDSQISEKIETK